MLDLALSAPPAGTPNTRIADVGRLRKNNHHAACALPAELTFWALWHCRHARPPDATPLA
ncbi:hypothetical protein NVV93_08030 [Pseudomonas sp. LS44]|uniref:hypothetical protein n=1 Tax=Pseudomonas sp. LS44 TaxID=1357074 RepID=UPI00215AEAF8|nr:hypothetical protein [Pseudomonas sp. LS44]UVE19311.1 hypothetical protein NVV93_08030 [Pseudomonas sp. LS44]